MQNQPAAATSIPATCYESGLGWWGPGKGTRLKLENCPVGKKIDACYDRGLAWWGHRKGTELGIVK